MSNAGKHLIQCGRCGRRYYWPINRNGIVPQFCRPCRKQNDSESKARHKARETMAAANAPADEGPPITGCVGMGAALRQIEEWQRGK